MSEYELVNRFISEKEAIASRARAAKRGTDISLNDPKVDEQWARMQQSTQGPRPYYDYFYSGEDIRVYMAEVGDDVEFGNMPIYQLAFRVEQQKKPLYGFWNYTYNAVMRGTRLVVGEMTILTSYPDYMKKTLAKAASNRVKNHSSLADDYPAPSTWRQDDENISEYWGQHLDQSALLQLGSEWSIHPPFSLVVVYGIQGTSMEERDLETSFDKYDKDNTLYWDHNQRLVEAHDERNSSRLILDGCELQSVERVYATSQIVAERYTFFARDVIIPQINSTSTKRDSRVSIPGTNIGGLLE